MNFLTESSLEEVIPFKDNRKRLYLKWPLNNNHMDRAQEFPVYGIITLMQRSRPGWDRNSINKENDLYIWKRNPDRPKAGDSPAP